jgi:hypothetical protein
MKKNVKILVGHMKFILFTSDNLNGHTLRSLDLTYLVAEVCARYKIIIPPCVEGDINRADFVMHR